MTNWTTLLGWAGIRRSPSASVPQREAKIFFIEQNTPHVPREYLALYTYLERRYASVVVLTLEQIETLLGFALPVPARTECEWWTDTAGARPHCAAWIEGQRTATPNLAARTVTFERSM